MSTFKSEPGSVRLRKAPPPCYTTSPRGPRLFTPSSCSSVRTVISPSTSIHCPDREAAGRFDERQPWRLTCREGTGVFGVSARCASIGCPKSVVILQNAPRQQGRRPLPEKFTNMSNTIVGPCRLLFLDRCGSFPNCLTELTVLCNRCQESPEETQNEKPFTTRFRDWAVVLPSADDAGVYLAEWNWRSKCSFANASQDPSASGD